MKAGVITFPGSNCDDDVRFVLEKVCEFNVTTLWHKDSPELGEFQLIVVPGGFSYGDYLRSGAMAALSPIMAQVKTFAENGGLVLGICNGFQILCEARLLPGALARNEGLGFICRDSLLKVASAQSPWTCEMKEGETLSLPIAHGEGRYVIPESELSALQQNGQILLTYQDNPNGSQKDIAGLCNAKKNVFGLMPHPERATDLRSKDGLKLWRSVLTTLKGSNLK